MPQPEETVAETKVAKSAALSTTLPLPPSLSSSAPSSSSLFYSPSSSSPPRPSPIPETKSETKEQKGSPSKRELQGPMSIQQAKLFLESFKEQSAKGPHAVTIDHTNPLWTKINFEQFAKDLSALYIEEVEEKKNTPPPSQTANKTFDQTLVEMITTIINREATEINIENATQTLQGSLVKTHTETSVLVDKTKIFGFGLNTARAALAIIDSHFSSSAEKQTTLTKLKEAIVGFHKKLSSDQPDLTTLYGEYNGQIVSLLKELGIFSGKDQASNALEFVFGVQWKALEKNKFVLHAVPTLKKTKENKKTTATSTPSPDPEPILLSFFLPMEVGIKPTDPKIKDMSPTSAWQDYTSKEWFKTLGEKMGRPAIDPHNPPNKGHWLDTFISQHLEDLNSNGVTPMKRDLPGAGNPYHKTLIAVNSKGHMLVLNDGHQAITESYGIKNKIERATATMANQFSVLVGDNGKRMAAILQTSVDAWQFIDPGTGPLTVPILHQTLLGGGGDKKKGSTFLTNKTVANEDIQLWLINNPPYLTTEGQVAFKKHGQPLNRGERRINTPFRQTNHRVNIWASAPDFLTNLPSSSNNKEEIQAVYNDGVDKLALFIKKFGAQIKHNLMYKPGKADPCLDNHVLTHVFNYLKEGTPLPNNVKATEGVDFLCHFLHSTDLSIHGLEPNDALKINLLIQALMELRLLRNRSPKDRVASRKTEHRAVMESIVAELIGYKLGGCASSLDRKGHHDAIKYMQISYFMRTNKLLSYNGDLNFNSAWQQDLIPTFPVQIARIFAERATGSPALTTREMRGLLYAHEKIQEPDHLIINSKLKKSRYRTTKKGYYRLASSNAAVAAPSPDKSLLQRISNHFLWVYFGRPLLTLGTCLMLGFAVYASSPLAASGFLMGGLLGSPWAVLIMAAVALTWLVNSMVRLKPSVVTPPDKLPITYTIFFSLLALSLLVGCTVTLFGIFAGGWGLGIAAALALSGACGFLAWSILRYIVNASSGGIYTYWAATAAVIAVSFAALMILFALAIPGSLSVALGLGLTASLFAFISAGCIKAARTYHAMDAMGKETAENTRSYRIAQGVKIALVIAVGIGLLFLALLSLAAMFNLGSLGPFSHLMDYSFNIMIQLGGASSYITGTQWLGAFSASLFGIVGFGAYESIRSLLHSLPHNQENPHKYQKHALLAKHLFKLVFTLGIIVLLSSLPSSAFALGGTKALLLVFLIMTLVTPIFSGNARFPLVFSWVQRFNTTFNQYLGLAPLASRKHYILREFLVTVALGALLALSFLPGIASTASALTILPILVGGIAATLFFRWTKMAADHYDLDVLNKNPETVALTIPEPSQSNLRSPAIPRTSSRTDAREDSTNEIEEEPKPDSESESESTTNLLAKETLNSSRYEQPKQSMGSAI